MATDDTQARLDAIRERVNAATETTTHYEWLIERGQPEGLDNAEWFSHYATGGSWTRDAHKASMFPTRELAEAWIEREGLSARAVEHGFMAQDSDAGEDVLLLLDELARVSAERDELRAALRDAEEFIDQKHTAMADDPECPACKVIATTSAALARGGDA